VGPVHWAVFRRGKKKKDQIPELGPVIGSYVNNLIQPAWKFHFWCLYAVRVLNFRSSSALCGATRLRQLQNVQPCRWPVKTQAIRDRAGGGLCHKVPPGSALSCWGVNKDAVSARNHKQVLIPRVSALVNGYSNVSMNHHITSSKYCYGLYPCLRRPVHCS